MAEARTREAMSAERAAQEKEALQSQLAEQREALQKEVPPPHTVQEEVLQHTVY